MLFKQSRFHRRPSFIEKISYSLLKCSLGQGSKYYHLHLYSSNFERCHSAIGNVTPTSVYDSVILYEVEKEVV